MLTKKAEKYLSKFERQERKLQKKLFRLDSSTSKYFSYSNKKCKQLISSLNDTTSSLKHETPTEYDYYLDTEATSMRFLKSIGNISNAEGPLKAITSIENNFESSEKIKTYITERKAQLNEILSKYTNLPIGIKKQYLGLSRTAYYYSEQLQEYKNILKDQKKVEARVIAELKKIPAFKDFMRKNNLLAKLFPFPHDLGTIETISGLQSRTEVQSQLLSRFASHSVSEQNTSALPSAFLNQKIQEAQTQLSKIKEEANNIVGNNNNHINIKDIKPNTQKTKIFWSRIEYGVNIQTQKENAFLPRSSTLSLSLGYKLNDKAIIGLGSGYKIGLGKGPIKSLRLTNEGISFRSFLEVKIKSSFLLASGYEINYNSSFKDFAQLKNVNALQRSALAGISKRYNISKKLKGEMQLLYDFLANFHIPVSQPVIFRLGYKF